MTYLPAAILRKLRAIRQCSVRFCSFSVESTKYLSNRGVTMNVIDDNPFLLNLDIDELQHKMEIVKQMRPRHINDFVPLLRIEEPILRDVGRKAAEEYDTIPENHRIYFFSRELQITPVTVSKFCSKNETIFFAKFAGIAKKLKILLDYNVDSTQILQSLYVFDYSEKRLFSRLDDLLKRSLDYKSSYFTLSDDAFRKAINLEVQKIPVEPSPSPHKLKNRNMQKSSLLTEINGMLSCDDHVSTQIYYGCLDHFEKLSPAERNIQLLTTNGVGLQCIQSNPVVLTLPYAQINDNIQLIKEMRPISIEDFLPLVKVKTKTLRDFARDVNKREVDLHPIYLFSKKLNIICVTVVEINTDLVKLLRRQMILNLKISPAIVSQHFANHSKLFYYQDFDGLLTKLTVLVAYNVEPMSILQSPRTFSVSASTLETRLREFKVQRIENISSWMVGNTTRKRMEICVARLVEEQTSLGECADTVDYIAKRLNWDAAAKEKVLQCNPSLVKCSVTRVKNHLDYLLKGTHFTIDDISSFTSVFRTNLDELKLRMGEMAEIGLVPSKLYEICLAKRSYLEMVWKFCQRKNCPTAFALFKSIEKRVTKLK